jgi:hypothetical protein
MTVRELLDVLNMIDPDIYVCVECTDCGALYTLKSVEITSDVVGNSLEVILHT